MPKTKASSKVMTDANLVLASWRPHWRGDLIGLGDHLRDLILEITANPKPNYSLPNGEVIQWGHYLDVLMKSYGVLQGLLEDLDDFEYKRPYWYAAQHRSYRRYGYYR